MIRKSMNLLRLVSIMVLIERQNKIKAGYEMIYG